MIVKFRKYDSYKDSGVEWLSDIPVGWDAVKMKYLFKDVSIKNKPDEALLSVTQNMGVVPRSWVENRMVMPSGGLDAFKYIEKGDFSISLRSFEGGLEYCHHHGIISPAYTVLKKRNDLIAEYYKYLFKSKSFIYEMQTSIVGIREGKNISYPILSYSLLPVPDSNEQTAIANFLDEKTAKIDKVIAQKEKMIALLKERKQILIQNAVTGKVVWNEKENAWTKPEKVKDSGVEWIGEIPEGWEVKKVKHVSSKIGSGITPSGGGDTYLDEGGIPLLRSQNVHFGKVDLSDVARIRPETHDSMANSKVKFGDILLNITGGSIGRCHYMDLKGEFNVNQHVCIIRPKCINTVYFNYLFVSEVGQGQIWFYQQGGGREGLNFQAIKNFFIPNPSIKEQDKIVSYINMQSYRFEKAITLQQTQIQKLKEYKAVLIDSAVTGKIKVS